MTKRKAGLCIICKWGTKVCVTKIQKHKYMIKSYKTNHPQISPQKLYVVNILDKYIYDELYCAYKKGMKPEAG